MKIRIKTNSGQATIETALVLPLFLFFFFAVIEGGLALYQWHLLFAAARSGVEIASMAPVADIQTNGQLAFENALATSSPYMSDYIINHPATPRWTIPAADKLSTEPIMLQVSVPLPVGNLDKLIPPLKNFATPVTVSSFYAVVKAKKAALDPLPCVGQFCEACTYCSPGDLNCNLKTGCKWQCQGLRCDECTGNTHFCDPRPCFKKKCHHCDEVTPPSVNGCNCSGEWCLDGLHPDGCSGPGCKKDCTGQLCNVCGGYGCTPVGGGGDDDDDDDDDGGGCSGDDC